MLSLEELWLHRLDDLESSLLLSFLLDLACQWAWSSWLELLAYLGVRCSTLEVFGSTFKAFSVVPSLALQ